MSWSYLKTITNNVFILTNIFVLVWFAFLFVCLFVCLSISCLVSFGFSPNLWNQTNHGWKRIICLCHEIVTVLHKKKFSLLICNLSKKNVGKVDISKEGKTVFSQTLFLFLRWQNKIISYDQKCGQRWNIENI